MKKRILASLMCLCLLVGLLPTAALAVDEEPGGEPDGTNAVLLTDNMSGYCGAEGNENNVTWALEQNNDDDENPTYTLTISGTGEIKSWAAGSVLAYYKSNTNYDNPRPWDSYNESISSVIVEDGITKIGDCAFLGFINLKEISFADTVEEIGQWAFGFCRNLPETIQFPANLKKMGYSAFRHTSGLKTITLPATLENLGTYTFTGGTNTSWPMWSPDESGVYSCSLETVDLSRTQITSIGDQTFAGCETLEKIILPDTLTALQSSAFKNCVKLSTINIPSTLTTIGSSCFSGCTSLTSFTFNEQSTIGDRAFEKSGLAGTIVIPAGITMSTGANGSGYQFSDCTKISGFVVETPNFSIPQGWTSGCNNINAWDFSQVASLSVGIYSLLITPGNNKVPVAYVSNSTIATQNRNNLIGYSSTHAATNAIAATNGGTFAADAKFESGTLATPTKEGAIFEGWYANAQFTGEKVTTATAGQTYYAKWTGLEDMELEYGYEQKMTVSGDITLSGYTSDNPSVATVDGEGNVTAVGVGTAKISATGTYNDEQKTFSATVTVIPMNITFGGEGENPGATLDHVYDGMAPDYFDYATFYPAEVKDGKVSVVAGSSEVELVAGTDVVFLYKDTPDGGETEHSALPVAVTGTDGTNVTVKLVNPNYRFVTNTHQTPSQTVSVLVKIQPENMDKQDLYINGEKVDAITGATVKVYNGQGQAPISDLTSVTAEGIDTFTVHFHPLNNDTEFAEAHLEDRPASGLTSEAVLAIAPKKPGEYLMIVNGIKEAADGNNGKYAYASVVFSIEKAEVTITPDDKSIYVGDALPELTYTVIGLVGNDGLTRAPELTCEADTSTAGTYSITASGAEIDEELYTLTYGTGTLTVLERTSSGGGGGGGGSSSYSVSVDSGRNGSVSVSPKNASKGTTVTITVKPDAGYVLDGLTVTDKNGDTVKLTDKGNGKYTFTMPSGKVTVEATFVEEQKESALPFRDVDVDDWFYDAVAYVYDNGMMSGVSQHEFAPNSTLTRGMLVQILWAMEDKPQVNYLMKYNDVATSAWYAEAVRWASAEGIVSGYGDTFGPEDPITREQLALILYGYAKLNEADTEQGGMSIREYADYGRISSWALEAMDWAVNAGILSGKSASTLDPTGTATRAEAAQMLRNLCEIME